MILKSLELKNFRTYKGPELVNFAQGDKNVTIILGNNEVGKTTIMNAITWCLYGVEHYKKEGKEPIWSKSTAYDMNTGDEEYVEVIITMDDSKGREVKFFRRLDFYKNDAGQVKASDQSFDIYIDDSIVTFEHTYLNKHLPEKIREYFLFDGEQLEKYFTGDTTNVKKAVYKLSQLNLLKNIEKHISYREDDFIKELDRLNPSLGREIARENKLNKQLEKLQERVKEITTNINRWEITIKNLEEELSTYGEDPDKLISLRKKLDNQLKKEDKNIRDKEKEYNKFLLSNTPKIYSLNYLNKVKVICADLEEKGFIPAEFKKEFLEYLLERSECVCGADLSEGSEAYLKMKELCDRTDTATNISEHVNRLLGRVNGLINDFPTGFQKLVIDKNQEIDDLKQQRSETAKKIIDIDEKLSADDQKEVSSIQNDLDTYRKLIKDNSEKKGSITNQISTINDNLIEISKRIEKEKSKDATRSDLQQSIDFCKEIKIETKRLYDVLEKDIQMKLQRLTSEEFEKMHWKEFYEGVSIDKDYNVTIHKKGGDIEPNDLSKGGQLILALSFMTALNSLSGFELPIIIDTPMGRLDEPIKKNIGRSLPDYTRGKQVTLLVTGSEYSDEFKRGIREYVGKEYTLNYVQEKDGITRIVEKM